MKEEIKRRWGDDNDCGFLQTIFFRKYYPSLKVRIDLWRSRYNDDDDMQMTVKNDLIAKEENDRSYPSYKTERESCQTDNLIRILSD